MQETSYLGISDVIYKEICFFFNSLLAGRKSIYIFATL